MRDRSVVRSPVVAQIGKGQHDNREARRSLRLRGRKTCRGPRRRLIEFAYLADKAHALAVHGTNDALRRAAVVDGLSRRVQARRQCRVGDDPPAPNPLDQIVLADDPAAVLHQIDQQVEYLRFERDLPRAAAQLAPLGI